MRFEKKPVVKLEGWERKREATYETNHLGGREKFQRRR